MDPVQPSRVQPHLDGAGGEAEVAQLRRGDDAVLSAGKVGNPRVVVVRLQLTTYHVGFVDLTLHAASVAAKCERFTARM